MDMSRGGSFAVMQIRPLRRRGKAPISPFVDRRNNYLSAPDNLGASHRLDPENNCAVDCLPSLKIGRASCRGKSVDLGGRRIIKKKKKKKQRNYRYLGKNIETRKDKAQTTHQ